ncbi:hypothetical protein AB6A40_008316 [Gnathostoma spinigerum]|uniref:Uncharacterized protein n=1 Tax=Gnathostoma spinigerum TaxID=75299 RepID=A0ABD6EYC1_9BILA
MLCTLGWQRSVIAHLSLLPCHYFFDPDLKRILLPTVIAVCYKNEVAVEVIKQEFNPLMLANYLEACEPGNTGDPLVDQRFPALIWPEVISYFKIC